MSEVLRAVLDRNCIDSRVAIYGAQLPPAVATGAGVVYRRRQTSIACKSDTYFLLMSAALDTGFDAGSGGGWQPKAQPSTFQIVRGNTGEAFSIAAQPTVLKNYNLNNLVTLDEYILFDPAELIQINMDVRFNTTVPGALLFDFITLLGVEYQMPEGRS